MSLRRSVDQRNRSSAPGAQVLVVTRTYSTHSPLQHPSQPLGVNRAGVGQKSRQMSGRAGLSRPEGTVEPHDHHHDANGAMGVGSQLTDRRPAHEASRKPIVERDASLWWPAESKKSSRAERAPLG